MSGSRETARPLAGFALACLLSLAAAWLLIAADSAAFAAYLGGVDPRAAILVCGAAGAGALAVLKRFGWTRQAPDARQAGLVAALAAGFAVPTVIVDVLQPFPPDINQPLPAALVFYPAIAFVVEVLFHLLPLAVLVVLWHLVSPAVSSERYWIAAVPVAMLEPAFQVAAGFGGQATWRDIYLGLHLFAFSMVQLAILRRSGFLAMLGFRLVYYLIWHILWGAARLHLLF